MEETQRIYGERADLTLAGTKEAALRGADALVIMTEWKVFRAPDFDADPREAGGAGDLRRPQPVRPGPDGAQRLFLLRDRPRPVGGVGRGGRRAGGGVLRGLREAASVSRSEPDRRTAAVRPICPSTNRSAPARPSRRRRAFGTTQARCRASRAGAARLESDGFAGLPSAFACAPADGPGRRPSPARPKRPFRHRRRSRSGCRHVSRQSAVSRSSSARSRKPLIRKHRTTGAAGFPPPEFALSRGAEIGKEQPLRILVTGAAGFIGFHVARALLARGDAVTGFDVVNDYYDPALKEARLAELDAAAAASGGDWAFLRADLADEAAVAEVFAARGPFDRVIHLAAQAGVRYSLENPVAYVRSNVLGFTHVIEACRRTGGRPAHLRLDLERLRRQRHDAVHREPGRRPSAAVLRRDQARQRADGARLQPSLPAADHRPALLHRLRPLGPARHGADAVRRRHPRRAGRSSSTTPDGTAATSPTSTTSSRG